MAKELLLGIDKVSRNVPEILLGVDNAARQVIEGYIGDENGVAKLFYQRNCEVTITGYLAEYAKYGDSALVTINGTNYSDTLKTPVVLSVPPGTSAVFSLKDSSGGTPYIMLNNGILRRGDGDNDLTYSYTITTDTNIQLRCEAGWYQSPGVSQPGIGGGGGTSVGGGGGYRDYGVAHITTS